MKNVKIITIILAIILVTLVAFGGVYIKTQNRMENKVKDYQLGREFAGQRVVELDVVKEGDSKTAAEQLTAENYEIVKNTIEKRIKNVREKYPTILGPLDYTISLDKEKGKIRIEMPENENTDLYVYYFTADSKVNIKEKDAKTELLKDSMVEDSIFTYTVVSHNHEIGDSYQVYLLINLNEEGQAKIEEIKNNYAILEQDVKKIEEAQEAAKKEENSNAENTATEEMKKIAVLTVAGNEYNIAKIEGNTITAKIGIETTNQTSINTNINAASELAMLINSGKYPITYELEKNEFVYAEKSENKLIILAIIIGILMVALFVIFTIKYKIKGLLASISYIGFVSILSLVIRYVNINISIEGIGAIILTLIINARINQYILKKGNDINYKELVSEILPVIIITLVFSFANWQNLSSFGMIMFWGLILIAIYNATVTKTLLKLKESK